MRYTKYLAPALVAAMVSTAASAVQTAKTNAPQNFSAAQPTCPPGTQRYQGHCVPNKRVPEQGHHPRTAPSIGPAVQQPRLPFQLPTDCWGDLPPPGCTKSN